MPFLDNFVKDAALHAIRDNATILHMCSFEPTDYSSMLSYSLGTKADPVISSPLDISGQRAITVSAIIDGIVHTAGGATHWALADTINLRLLATQQLLEVAVLDLGSPFFLNEFSIRIEAEAGGFFF